MTTPFFGDVFSVDAQYAFNRSGDEAVANTEGQALLCDWAETAVRQDGEDPRELFRDQRKRANRTPTRCWTSARCSTSTSWKLTGAYALPKFETTPVKGEAKKYNRFLVGATLPLGNWSCLLASYAYLEGQERSGREGSAMPASAAATRSRSAPATYFGYSRIDANDSLKGKGYSVADSSNAATTIAPASTSASATSSDRLVPKSPLKRAPQGASFYAGIDVRLAHLKRPVQSSASRAGLIAGRTCASVRRGEQASMNW